MLSELFNLARNLTVAGMDMPLVHRDFGRPSLSTCPTLRASLNERGEIVRMSPIAIEDAPALWKLQSGNHGAFPAVRLNLLPALPIPAELRAKKQVDLTDLTTLLRAAQSATARKLDAKITKSIQQNCKRFQAWQSNGDSVTLEQLHKFSQAFDKFCASPEAAVQNILKGVEGALQLPCDEKLRATLAILLAGENFVGNQQSVHKETNKKSNVEHRVQLCFDLRDSNDIAFSLYSPRVEQVVLECLNAEPVQSTASGICSMSGRPLEAAAALFPKWAAKGVVDAPIPIFSKNQDAPCNARYGRVGIESFLVEDAVAKQIVSALRAITDKPQGTNWRSLRNGKFEGTGATQRESLDVLIAYPTVPIEDLPLVNLFAPRDGPQDNGSKEFQDQARPIIEAFSTVDTASQAPDYVVILLIRKISKAQVQLVYSATPTRLDFVKAIDLWRESGDNLPLNLLVPRVQATKTQGDQQQLRAPNGMEGGITQIRPQLLFPEEISRVLSRHWIRSGAETTAVEAPPVGQILDLFLRKSGVWQDIAGNLLEVALTRTSVLLTHAGHILHRARPTTLEAWREFTQKSKLQPDYALSQTLSLFGSLLYAMNSHVKNYVEEPAYHIGQLLALMDELHKCYGIAVRDGDVPNSLMGNGLLGRAADSPTLALAELGERSRIYVGWAKTAAIKAPVNSDPKKIAEAKEKNDAILSARQVLSLAGPLTEKLHAAGLLDSELSAVQKAHLFLGYLSPVQGEKEAREKTPGATSDAPANGTNIST